MYYSLEVTCTTLFAIAVISCPHNWTHHYRRNVARGRGIYL